MKKAKLIIKGKLPGLNELIDAERTHRQAGARLKRNAEERICWHIKTQLRGHFERPVRLNYTFYEPNKKRDKDNISGFAHKVIQDSLVKSRILKNDGWNYIDGFTDDFAIDPKNPRIEVIIKEIEN